MENKRKLSQIIATLLCNANIKGLFTGRLYTGPIKSICVPGLNCYSCPAALGGCPLGALQSTLTTLRSGINSFVVGSLVFFAAVFGRFTCGWLCPFGLIQELLYMIPTPKYRTRFKYLGWLKYVILVVLVIAVPIAVMLEKGIGYPAFCKYICPQGTLGGLFLIRTDAAIRSTVGYVFILKILILLAVLMFSVVVFRPFCRLICPLGAIYGLFNSVALIRMDVDPVKCTHCSGCCQ